MLELVEKAMISTGIGYQRLDGSKSLSQRDEALKEFRLSPDCEVLLTTLGAGGVGYGGVLTSPQYSVQ